MKTTIAQLFLVFAYIAGGKCLTAEQEAMMKEMHTACVPVSGVTEAMIAQAKTGDFPDASEFKEYMLCMAKKAGIMSESGELQTDLLSKMLNMHLGDATKADQLLVKCGMVKATPQDTIFEVSKCMFAVKKFF